ncbi:hypothetical protein MTBPR1_10285 [Candidatus Terasakiella magnetica]|uniref:Uncharacterized protein n=1 Tax=Candidatus Terasakiella magnetica TaxID=1867952 RepID=A0A1C3RCS0_9PROT|nr:hypothetical protein [Candidatus Terasakiella magnetica]SCA55038.1 hypothetical protein MTBPR1_10285 [Candidatus Terasakiella magnetica]
MGYTVNWYYVAWVGGDNEIKISSYHHRSNSFEDTIETGIKTSATPKLIQCQGFEGNIARWALVYFDMEGKLCCRYSNLNRVAATLGTIWENIQANSPIGKIAAVCPSAGARKIFFPRQVESKLTPYSVPLRPSWTIFDNPFPLDINNAIKGITATLHKNTGMSACLSDDQICVVIALTGTGDNLKKSNIALIVYNVAMNTVSGGLVFPNPGSDQAYLTDQTPTICKTSDGSGILIGWTGIDDNNSLNLLYLDKAKITASRGIVAASNKHTTTLNNESSDYAPVLAQNVGENGLFWIGKDANHQFNYLEVELKSKLLLWSLSTPEDKPGSKHSFDFPSSRKFGLDVIGDLKEQFT